MQEMRKRGQAPFSHGRDEARWTASIDWDAFRGRTTFITGEDKNSGKTTFLKHAITSLRERELALAYMSAGVDGEAFDLISGAPKPVITAEEGDCIVTAESALSASDAGFEVIRSFPDRTVLGSLALVRTTRRGLIELIGPETNRALGEVLESVRGLACADAVLVDGAVDRVTQVGSSGGAGYVLALRVTPSTLQRSARRARLAVLLDGIPVLDGGAEEPGCFALEGALTAGKLGRIPVRCAGLALEDFTRVFLDYAGMARLCREHPVFFRNRYALISVVVVLEGVEREEFLGALRGEADRAPVYFSPYRLEPGQVS